MADPDARRVLVTGGADGLGRSIVEALVREGMRVVIFDIDLAKAAKLSDELNSVGGKTLAVGGSVASAADIDAAFVRIDEWMGGLDILINNAGITGNCPALEITDEYWDRLMATNLRGAFLCARAVGTRMIVQGSGTILNISSIFGGVVAAPNRLAYCVAKSGVATMAKVLAIEWGPKGVRVNAIAPGYIATPGTAELVEMGRLDLQQIRNRTPAGRLATPEEVAELVLFACSPAADFIAGQVIGIDGGWTAYGYL